MKGIFVSLSILLLCISCTGTDPISTEISDAFYAEAESIEKKADDLEEHTNQLISDRIALEDAISEMEIDLDFK